MISALLLMAAAPAAPAAEQVGIVAGWSVWRFANGTCTAVKGPPGSRYRPLGVSDHFQGATPFVQISRRHGARGGLGIGVEARYVRAQVRARAAGEKVFAPVTPAWPKRLEQGEVELWSAGYLYPHIRYGLVEETARIDMTGAAEAKAAVAACMSGAAAPARS